MDPSGILRRGQWPVTGEPALAVHGGDRGGFTQGLLILATIVSFLEQVHPRCSVLSAMLFAVVASPDRRHIADIPRYGDAATAEMIVLRTLHLG